MLVVLHFCGFNFQWFTVTIWTSAWSIPSVKSTTRYRESQVSPTVVIDRTFTLGGGGGCGRLLTDHHHVSFLLNFRCWSQLRD